MPICLPKTAWPPTFPRCGGRGKRAREDAKGSLSHPHHRHHRHGAYDLRHVCGGRAASLELSAHEDRRDADRDVLELFCAEDMGIQLR